MRWILPGLLLLVLAAGCGKAGTGDAVSDRPLTEEERNRAIARAPLPGAPVVGRALAVRDSSAARTARLDGLAR
jgi:hypothetical protein